MQRTKIPKPTIEPVNFCSFSLLLPYNVEAPKSKICEIFSHKNNFSPIKIPQR